VVALLAWVVDLAVAAGLDRGAAQGRVHAFVAAEVGGAVHARAPDLAAVGAVDVEVVAGVVARAALASAADHAHGGDVPQVDEDAVVEEDVLGARAQVPSGGAELGEVLF